MQRKSFYTREEVNATKKPFRGMKFWYNLDIDEKKIYLTKTRAEELRCPIETGEEPVAFRYTSNGPAQEKYVPIYDRTKFGIDEEELYPKEIVEPDQERDGNA